MSRDREANTTEQRKQHVLVLTSTNNKNTLAILRPAHIRGSSREHVVLSLENVLLVDGVPDADLALVV